MPRLFWLVGSVFMATAAAVVAFGLLTASPYGRGSDWLGVIGGILVSILYAILWHSQDV